MSNCQTCPLRKAQDFPDYAAWIRNAKRSLALLDDIATSYEAMGSEDIERLCVARAILAEMLGFTYNTEMERYS